MRLPWIKANKASKPESLTFTAPVELVAAAGEDGKPKLPTFTITAYNGGSMEVGGFYYPVIVDLTGLKAAGKTLPILLDHQISQPVGQADKIEITPKGVTLSGIITGSDEHASKVVTHSKNGFNWQASIGASVSRREFLEAGKTATVNGKTVNGPAIIAREATLRECSFVAVGADSTTAASVAAASAAAATALHKDSDMKFNEWLKAQGLDAATLSAEQLTNLHATFDKLQKLEAAAVVTTPAAAAPVTPEVIQATAQPADIIARQNAEIAANMDRVAKINAECGTQHATIAAQAIRENWSVEKTQLEVFRAARPAAPAVIVRNDNLTGDVLQAAACMAGGLQNIEKRFDDKTLQAAHTRFRGRMGLQEMLLEAAWANGYQGMSFRQDPGAVLRAAFSTLSLPGIFANTANKFLLQGYMHVEQTWKEIASIASSNDFKASTSYRLTGAFQFEQVGPDGQLKHGEVGEQSFTNQVSTYGKMFSITRQDLINDDLGALTALPQRIGRGAGLKLNDVFWTKWLDDATFFNTDNSRLNFLTGVTYVLGAAGLRKAVEQFRKQVDANGKPLGTSPDRLLVSPENEAMADELFQSTSNNTGGSSSEARVPNKNTHAGKYRPIVSTYLSNTAYSGYSTTAWYLLGNPLDVPGIEVRFLNGQQQPTVESSNADFNTLGIDMRGYFDFGVEKQDPRCGVKVKGAN